MYNTIDTALEEKAKEWCLANEVLFAYLDVERGTFAYYDGSSLVEREMEGFKGVMI